MDDPTSRVAQAGCRSLVSHLGDAWAGWAFDGNFQYIVEIVRMYGAAGMIVAVAFLFFGMDRIDEDVSGAYSFRVLLIPDVITLWSVVCVRWIVLERARRDASI